MKGPMANGRPSNGSLSTKDVLDTVLDDLENTPLELTWRARAAGPLSEDPSLALPEQTILSFDIEEHHRIEAAVGMEIDSERKAQYCERMQVSTHWLLDVLAQRRLQATFFLVGRVAEDKPALVRAIHAAGHEIASHSWDHKRVHHFTPEAFRVDLRRCKDVLQQLTGEPIYGFRAPTFSIVKETAWALDVLAEEGFLYDSSIYPVRHDRYGVPHAPRVPFLARAHRHSLLELPPATLRWLWTNVPVGGGGYFRLLPLFLMKRGLRQLHRRGQPSVAMLYFHPWEFDVEQPRLPLPRMSRFRTYVGLGRSRARFLRLIEGTTFVRAVDVARQLEARRNLLRTFELTQ
jgi:polysaccharide deacetylase family protein (PEP-CTERM system associated)